MSVLFVDDDAMIRDLFAVLAQELGVPCRIEPNPETALELFEAGAFEVVVTDLDMPQMSGDQFARALRRIDAEVPIYVYTGGSAFYSEGVLEQVFDGIYLKSQGLSTLFAEILKAMAVRQYPELAPMALRKSRPA